MVPTKGSSMILKASMEKGSSSDGLRTISAPVSMSMPLIASRSDGRRQIMHNGVEKRLNALF